MDEQQFILRLPDPLVDRMRFALSSNKKREIAGDTRAPSTFSVEFQDPRHATFTIDNVPYPATLMDLPTLVETHKTADKRTFYKSGNLHQVLVVRMPDDPEPTSYLLNDGLTPASKGAGKRLAESKKLYSQRHTETVESRVKYVIDHKIKMVSKKDKPPVQQEEELVVIEEETAEPGPVASSQKPPTKPSTSTSSAKPPTPASTTAKPTETAAAASTPMATSDVEVAPSPKPMTPMVGTPMASTPMVGTPMVSTPMVGTPMVGTPVVGTPAASTPMPMTPAAMTPVPMTPGVEADIDAAMEDMESEDDFEEMAGALMEDQEEEARRRVERVQLDDKIKEKKKLIEKEEARAAKAPNRVFRERIMVKVRENKAELQKMEEERKAMGN